MPEARPLLDHIAANVRRVRERRGWSQQELADRMEMTLRYLQRLEHGEVNFTIQVLERFSEALEVSAAHLVRRTPLPQPRGAGRPKKRRRSR